ncbi:hypothetical protein [Nocardia sp. BMG51109]|uniref:PIN-like domain-containing protein n=1 Tax=Nocardia sp. BMG51109 TaxID=1056816 RepID=UPI0004640A5E|nr:hypothetical protein [Nocardia sp. BMG51109]
MSGPPHASSWAAPPEFYIDENFAGRTLRRAIEDLGYCVHTPARLYGSRAKAQGTLDEVWLRDVGKHGWVAIGRDTTILSEPDELAAYKAAKIHMFLFDGNANRDELVRTLHALLRDICTHSSAGKPTVWRAHGGDHPRLEQL